MQTKEQQLNETLNEIELIKNEIQNINMNFNQRNKTYKVSQLLTRIENLEKNVSLFKTQIRRGERYQKRQEQMLNLANMNFNLFRDAFNENVQQIAEQQQQDINQGEAFLTVNEILRENQHQQLRILMNKLQDDQQLSVAEGYKLYVNVNMLNKELQQKLNRQLNPDLIQRFKNVLDSVSQAFKELETEQLSIPDESQIIELEGMRLDTRVAGYIQDVTNPDTIEQMVKGLKGMIKRLVNRFVYVNFGFNNFQGLNDDSRQYLIDLYHDNLYAQLKIMEQDNKNITQDWIKVFVQSINKTENVLDNFEAIQLNLRSVIDVQNPSIYRFFNQSIGLGKNVTQNFPNVSYDNEKIKSNRLLRDLREFIKYVNVKGQEQKNIFPSFQENIGSDYSPIEWFKESSTNILKLFFRRFDFIQNQVQINEQVQKYLSRREFNIKIPQNIGLQFFVQGLETGFDKFLPFFQAAWVQFYNSVDMEDAFSYLWHNSGIMRRFFLCFEIPIEQTNELKCSLSELIHYFFQIFSNKQIKFQKNWSDVEEERNPDFAILLRMLKQYDHVNFVNYWKIFNIDFLTLIRIISLVCLDSIRVCAYSSRGDSLSSVRLVQTGIYTQYFTRFSSFFTGGLFDQVIYLNNDERNLEYFGSSNIWGISTIAYFSTLIDILCKPWYFIENSQLWLQYYEDSYLWSFKKFSIVQKYQRNNKEGQEKLLKMGNRYKDIGEYISQNQNKFHGRFKTTSMFLGQLGTYAYINKGQALDNKGERIRGFKDFNISVLSKAIHLIRRQFHEMWNVNDLFQLIQDQQKIGLRLELLLKINNIFYVINQEIEQTQYKVLGANFNITLSHLRVRGVNLERQDVQLRLIRHLVYKILQIQDQNNEFKVDEINDIIQDYDEDTNYYESGWSVEDLENYYTNRFIDELEYRENLQNMDINVKEGKYRRDFYFENQSVQNDYTVQIVKSAMMIYQTKNVVNGKIEKNNFWIQRQVMSKILHGKKLDADQQSLLTKIRDARDLGLQQGFVPIEYRKYQCLLFTKIEDLFNDETCGQHLFIYFYVKLGIISEGLLNMPQLNLNDLRDLLTDNILYIRISEQPDRWKDILKVEFACEQQEVFLKSVYVISYAENETQVQELFQCKMNSDIYIVNYLNHVFVIDSYYKKKILKDFENQDLQLLLDQKIKGYSFQKRLIIGDQNDLKKKDLGRRDIEVMFNGTLKYEDVFEKQVLKQNVDKILIFYDIETTTKKSVQIDTEFELVPYLIVLQIVLISQINPEVRIENYKYFLKRYKHEQIITFEGYNCRQQFINFIKFIYVQQQHDIDKRKVIFLGWNSRRFDSQFVILELMKIFPYDTTLVGTLTNPKNFSLGKNIQFWDAMDMVSPMSLEKFCKAMNVQGKFNGEFMFEIQTVKDYFVKGYRQNLIEYCTQDVKAMKNGIIKFNRIIVDLLRQIRGDSIEIDQNYFILQKTVAKLSYQLFTQYLFPPIIIPQPIQSIELFKDVTLSYRGGMVNNFVFGMVDIQQQQHFVQYIDYIDINSLYPSVMSGAQIPLDFSQYFKHDRQLIDDLSDVLIQPLNLYRIVSFDCGENKFGKQQFGFFPVKVQIKKGITKTLYPQQWTGNEDNYMVVWGSEILLFRTVFKNYRLELMGNYECTLYGRVFACIGDMYNKRMEFKNDPQKKALAEAMKIIMNSCYGRFGMRAYQVKWILHENSLQSLTLEQQDQYLQRIIEVSQQSGFQFNEQDFTINSSSCFNGDSLINISIMKENSYMPRNFNQRVKFIASFIATQARCRLLASMYKLSEERDLTIYYCDTDSIVYGSRSMEAQDRLKQGKFLKWSNFDESYSSCLTFGTQLGQMKSEIENNSKMIKFQVFGPKFYRYQIQTDYEYKWVFKSKGINQKVVREFDEAENNRLNELRQILFFEKFQADLSASIEQQQIKSDKGRMQIYRFMKTNEICLGRKIGQGISEFLNFTDLFKNENEFLNFINKKIQLNKFSLQYEYI